ncbi:MAG: right-handed parallel beta-helix repeat-containing protein, partial [Gemmataceae bacterium]|nr:right-handed parallel beta-helix repeat-containing protein [Gemmataceae bacterium]
MSSRRSRPFRPGFENLEVRDVPATLFVSTAGADTNPGTLAAPLKTVQAASNRANAGDEIVLRGGTYAGGVQFYDANLTVRSYDGEWAVIAAPTDNVNVSASVWVREYADNLTLRRLEVSGGYYYAVKTQGTDGLTIEDSRLHDSGRDVIKLDPGSDGATIQRSTIYNSGRRDPSNAEGIDNTNADRMVVRDNYLYNIATTGIYPKGGATDSLIERNLIRGANIGVAVGFYTDAEWMDPAANPGYYESIRSVVRNNVIVDTRYAGIGLWASLDSRVYNNTLVNVAQTAQAGILFDRADHWVGGQTVWQLNRNAAVVNNVVSISGTGGRPVVELRPGSVAAGTLTLGNNVYYRPGGVGQYRDGNAGTVVLGLAAWQSRMGDVGSREADPRLDAGFHLLPGSPAVNAGRVVAGLADDYDRNARTGTPDAG